MLADEQERVAQLEVVDGRRRGPDVRVAHHGAAHEPALPATRRGAKGEVGLFAIREVTLVEQPDVLEADTAGKHQRPVWMPGPLPAFVGCRRREDAAEVRVEDGGRVVA